MCRGDRVATGRGSRGLPPVCRGAVEAGCDMGWGGMDSPGLSGDEAQVEIEVWVCFWEGGALADVVVGLGFGI